jgi:hypothetical protein
MGGVRVSVEGEGVGPFELCIFKICWRFANHLPKL